MIKAKTRSAVLTLLAAAGAVGAASSAQGSERIYSGSGIAHITYTDARGNRDSWTSPITYDNNVIDSQSLCSDMRRGSIEYRKCRKGAEDYLEDVCESKDQMDRTRRNMFCHAARAFRP